IVNTGAIVEHDCEIGSFVHAAPRALLCGDVKVGSGSQVGAGSVVRQGLRLGPCTVVGAGAVVVKDFEGHGVLIGNP
ncbi:acetyltransferase, partial [Acinetobacter baumannii]